MGPKTSNTGECGQPHSNLGEGEGQSEEREPNSGSGSTSTTDHSGNCSGNGKG